MLWTNINLSICWYEVCARPSATAVFIEFEMWVKELILLMLMSSKSKFDENLCLPFFCCSQNLTLVTKPELTCQKDALGIWGIHLSSSCWISLRKKNAFFSILIWLRLGSWNPASWKTRTHLPYNVHRADSRLALSQWETLLQSNAVSHWLGTKLEAALAHIMAADELVT